MTTPFKPSGAFPPSDSDRKTGANGTQAKSAVQLKSPSAIPSGLSLGDWEASGVDMLGTKPAPRKWLVRQQDAADEWHGWLPQGIAGLFAGAGGVGKTYALLQLAVAVASGTEWLGMKTTRQRVYFAVGEEDAAELHRRVYAVAQTMSEGAKAALRANLVLAPLRGVDVALVQSDGAGNIERTPALEHFRDELEHLGPFGLVLLDPLSRFASGEVEKSNDVATRFFEAAEWLSKAEGSPTVLVAHHASQSSQQSGEREATAVRGVTALTDAARWVALMTRHPQGARLEVVKSNYGGHGSDVELLRGPRGVLVAVTASDRDREAKASREASEAAQAAEMQAARERTLEVLAKGEISSREDIVQLASQGQGRKVHRAALAELISEGQVIQPGKRKPYTLAKTRTVTKTAKRAPEGHLKLVLAEADELVQIAQLPLF